MEHWSVEDYKNYTNKTVKKTKYRATKNLCGWSYI